MYSTPSDFARFGPPQYTHTQSAPLHWILVATGIGCFVLAWIVRTTPGGAIGAAISAGSGLLMLLLAASFRHLRVEDRGDRLRIAFGPLTVFQRSLRYAEMDTVEVGRTTLRDGWGIHMSPRGGWVWNIWGRDCVIVGSGKRILRIGTDQPKQLALFLQSKLRR